MKARLVYILCSLFLFALVALPAIAQTPSAAYDAVNPIIGTAGGGNTFPGATLPFGMIQWSPDTNKDAWYRYDEEQVNVDARSTIATATSMPGGLRILGFSLTHISGAGCSLYGDLAVLPTAAALTSSPGASSGAEISSYAASFDHATEEAHPGYYAVTLASGIRVEITVAERAGIARLTFPRGVPARLLINAGSSANGEMAIEHPNEHIFVNNIELRGNDAYGGSSTAGGFCSSHSQYKIYVTGRFNQPFKSSSIWQDDSVDPKRKSAEGKRTGAWLDFGNAREVVLKVGISFVSQAGAEANLLKEIPGWNFDQVHAQARETWSRLLNRIAVEGGTPEQRTIFSTGVYHSFLSPNLFSDKDGNYIGFDGKVHSLTGSRQSAQYANYSDWDIYRNTVQFHALFIPERASDMMQSLVNDATQSGWYPRWPAANDVTYVMGGDSPTAVIASSYAFGAHNFDVETALKYMVKAGTEPGVGPHHNSERPYLADYRRLGYSPAEKDAISASRTLEYASDDFAIAQFARALGHESEYRLFLKYSQNWRNLIDPETLWIRPRLSDGTWEPGFDSEHSTPKRTDFPNSNDQAGFEEGNTWQYSFMVPFDYPALFAAMGGEDKVIPRLDRFFLKLRCWGEPCYNIENEPDFVVPYAYVFAGQPWKTQEVVARLAATTFKAAPDGIPGNDDLGATSGVYVWNALGFYPAIPGVGGVVLGAPMFSKATLHLGVGKILTISRRGSGIYVQSVKLNGKDFAGSWITLDKLEAGKSSLEFTMGPESNRERGRALADRPPAFR
jgi:predicted alpha-1,2-mannosidase